LVRRRRVPRRGLDPRGVAGEIDLLANLDRLDGNVGTSGQQDLQAGLHDLRPDAIAKGDRDRHGAGGLDVMLGMRHGLRGCHVVHDCDPFLPIDETRVGDAAAYVKSEARRRLIGISYGRGIDERESVQCGLSREAPLHGGHGRCAVAVDALNRA